MRSLPLFQLCYWLAIYFSFLNMMSAVVNLLFLSLPNTHRQLTSLSFSMDSRERVLAFLLSLWWREMCHLNFTFTLTFAWVLIPFTLMLSLSMYHPYYRMSFAFAFEGLLTSLFRLFTSLQNVSTI